MPKKKLLVFTGAGISAESGIRTFRDAGGLWEQYKIEEVATPQAWEKNRELVLEFYNQRRKQVKEAKPNEAHKFIAELQDHFDVKVVTQNVDDLHERAGSKFVLHLHGEIMKARSSVDPTLIYSLESHELRSGDTCEKGSQLRPHIVWFGEVVSEMEHANYLASQTDLFLLIGTSLNVYPAAGIINFVLPSAPKWVVDPVEFDLEGISNLNQINKTAVQSVPYLREAILKYA